MCMFVPGMHLWVHIVTEEHNHHIFVITTEEHRYELRVWILAPSWIYVGQIKKQEKKYLLYIWKQSERIRLDIISFHTDCFANEAWNRRKWEHVSCENRQSGKQIRCFGHSWLQQIINWFRTLVAVIRLREIRIRRPTSVLLETVIVLQFEAPHVLLKCDFLALQH